MFAKKIIQFVLCSAFAVVASGCNNKKASFSESSTQSQSYESSLSNESSSENPTESESLFWDVSDVDTSYVDPSKKLIALTFDDAPGATLENILAVFANFNETNPNCKATATIFFNGYRFDTQTPHLLMTALALGFELGNHTHSHVDLTKLPPQKLQEEIDKTDKLLAPFDKKERHLLRAPFGKTNELLKSVASVPIIDWTIDTLDWTGKSIQEIYDSIFENIFSGAIVLMHDGGKNTVEALKRILPDLMHSGYQAVNVSTLAKMHNCPLKNGGVYIRARQK